jgi:predicted NUDIX family phosphoesterase
MAQMTLQERAKALLTRFRKYARSPIVLEFAGVPKAGKTTTLNTVHTFLKRCGFRVETVVERASICPIQDKKHFNFNVWTACTSLSQILEKTQDPPTPTDPEILILDRGIFDALVWMNMMKKMGRLRSNEYKNIESFLLTDDWCKRITGVIVMTVSPQEAMKREQGLLPVTSKGSIMNEGILTQMSENTEKCIDYFKTKFNTVPIDTSPAQGATPKKTAETVANHVLNFIEDELEEEILSIESTLFKELMANRDVLTKVETQKLANLFNMKGGFSPRNVVENNDDRVQALPVAVIRNAFGEVLQLKRREKDKSKNALHEKMVIWAGGHTRKEDNTAKEGNHDDIDPLLQCVIRELQEELRLRVESSDLELLGAVYDDSDQGVSKHVAIVYEWRANTKEVDIVLNATEFFERRGSSLSGRFIDLKKLLKQIDAQQVTEPWTTKIATQLLKHKAPINQSLPLL